MVERKVKRYLEAGGTPVNKLDGLGDLDSGDGGVHVLRHHVTAVQ